MCCLLQHGYAVQTALIFLGYDSEAGLSESSLETAKNTEADVRLRPFTDMPASNTEANSFRFSSEKAPSSGQVRRFFCIILLASPLVRKKLSKERR